MGFEVQSTRSPFVIFLDIDGVVYNGPNQDGVSKKALELFPNQPNSRKSLDIAATHFFDNKAIENLNVYICQIEKTKVASIVLSSAWRTKRDIPEIKEVFSKHNFSKYIVSKTPDDLNPTANRLYCRDEVHTKSQYQFESCRATEIQYWLNQHPEIIQYVILDDNDNHLSQAFEDRLILTKYQTLFDEKTLQKALRHLYISQAISAFLSSINWVFKRI